MYFKLALKNVRKSYKDFAIYFLTLLLSVSIFYTFNSFDQQEVILNLNKEQLTLFQLISQVMTMLSVLVSLVCGFLILYANNFIIKRRKKELGLYMMLGMKNSRISRVLVYETFMIGLISLIGGLLLGFFLSQGITLVSANILAVSVDYHFVFSVPATLLTVLSFMLIFLVVMIFNTWIIGKYQLIDLLKANRVSEKRLRFPRPVSLILFAIALALIALAYYMGIRRGNLMMIMLVGAAGTFLFFFSLSGFMLRIFKSFPKFYYRNLNVFVLRQLDAKISSTHVTLSFVCLMLLLSLGALATGFSINQYVKNMLDPIGSFDVTYIKAMSTGTASDPTGDLQLDSKAIKAVYALNQYQSQHSFETVDVSDLSETMQSNLQQISARQKLYVIPLSDYNAFLQLDGYAPLHLDQQQTVLLNGNTNMTQTYEALKSKQITPFSTPLTVIDAIQPKTLFSVYNFYNQALIVNDEAIPAGTEGNQIVSIKLAEGLSDTVFADALSEQLALNPDLYPDPTVATKTEAIAQVSMINMMMTYVGLYLGSIFLISSVVVLALQQLSEAQDNAERYRVLSKIGVSQTMINRSILAQISVYFIAPLILACVHLVFGFDYVIAMLQAGAGLKNLMQPAILISGIVLAIYGGYFIFTYQSSKNMIANALK